MARDHNDDISFDEFDDLHSPRPETCDFDRIVEAAISRRGMLGGVMLSAFVCLVGSSAAGWLVGHAYDRISAMQYAHKEAHTEK